MLKVLHNFNQYLIRFQFVPLKNKQVIVHNTFIIEISLFYLINGDKKNRFNYFLMIIKY